MLICYETQLRTNLLLMSLTNSSFHNNLHSTPHTVQLSIISQAQLCFAEMREQFLASPSQLTWSTHWGLECPHIPQPAQHPPSGLLQRLHLPHQGSQESPASAIIKTFSTFSRCFARNIYANFGKCNLVLFFTSSVLPCKWIRFMHFTSLFFLNRFFYFDLQVVGTTTVILNDF